jgi:hypothetical protein
MKENRMSSDFSDKPAPDDLTIPSASKLAAKKPASPRREDSSEPVQTGSGIVPKLGDDAPWLLQAFFNHQLDLGAELVSRFPNLPLMSVFRARAIMAGGRHSVATLANGDGSAMLLVDVDGASGGVQLGCSYNSMITLRFRLHGLSLMDRDRWLELMRQEQGGVAFLWSQARWEQDYLVAIVRQHFANLYAFSQNGFEAAVRLTPEVVEKLLDWLEATWQPGSPPADEPPKLLTW